MIGAVWTGVFTLQSGHFVKHTCGVALLWCLAMVGLGIANAYADEALNDLGGRMEYAFYAADSRSLRQSLQAMEKLDVAASDAAQYNDYLNYGRWKLAQLLAKDDKNLAEQAAQACADSKPVAKSPSGLAVHHALVAACFGMLEKLRPLRSKLYRSDRESALKQAVELDGKITQVQLVAAWLAVSNDSAAQAYDSIKHVAEQYSAIPTTGPSTAVSWGYAEAFFLLGQAEQARANRLAARDALEQALILASDYRDAKQALRSLSLK